MLVVAAAGKALEAFIVLARAGMYRTALTGNDAR